MTINEQIWILKVKTLFAAVENLMGCQIEDFEI